MNKFTRAKFRELEKQQCELYGVESMSESFNIDPAQAQRIIAKTQESDAFLKQINVITVDEMSGQSLLLGVDGMIASRTDTTKDEREPKSVHAMTNNDYLCRKTDFDTHITYAKLDAWSHKPSFKSIIANQTLRAVALSMISIGWHGKSVAKATDIAVNPLGEDVNMGWLQHIKDRKAENFLDSEDVIIGDNVINLDMAVLECKSALGEIEQNNPDLVAIIGSDLLAHSKERLYAKNSETPSEKTRLELAQVIETFGGLPAYKIPYFPARGIMVTTFDNLSIYIHNSMRRQQIDNPKRDRVETYASKSLDYVVENYDQVSYIDSNNVKFKGE